MQHRKLADICAVWLRGLVFQGWKYSRMFFYKQIHVAWFCEFFPYANRI